MATSLIDELQLDASNSTVSVSSLLRKALMVAAKLAVSDIPDWINKELSGYKNEDSLPPYRILHGTIKARNLSGWIPVQFPTSDFRDMVSTHELREPVAQIEALIKRDGHLIFGFAPEQQQLLQTLFQFNTEFTGFLERTHLDGILDEIRNQVLRWAIALDKAGVRGDGLTFSSEEKDKAHSMVFHADNGSLTIGVVGTAAGRANVATGSHARASSIDVDDIRQLLAAIGQHIATLQLPSVEKSQLETALGELQPQTPTKQIEAGKVRQALDRILNIVGKAGETVLTVGTKAYIEAWMKQHGL